MGFASAHAQSYNILSLFSTSSNPAGQFSYGSKTSFTTSSYSLLTHAINSGGFQGWGSSSDLTAPAIVKNTSGALASIGTGNYSNGTLVYLPAAAAMSAIRFTVPTAGAYTLSGSFTFVATASGGDGVNVGITAFTGTTPTVLAANTKIGPTTPTTSNFSLTTDTLAAGSVIDFIVSDGPANATGDSARITGTITKAAVPEPTTLCGVGLATLAFLRRRKKK